MYPVLKHWEDDTTELEKKIITNYIWTSSYPKSNLVSDVEQKLLSLPVHPNSLPVRSGVRVARSLVFCVFFCRLFFFSFFLLTIVLFVLVRITASDYTF